MGSITLYEAEIWGWRKEGRLDKIQRKHVKWILELDRGTPNFIIPEKTKMKELSMEAVKKAIRYEETTRQSKKKIVIECIKELERGNRTGERKQMGKR